MKIEKEKTLAELIIETQFVVEATEFEQIALFSRWEKQIAWKYDSSKFKKQIGTLDNRPVIIQMVWSSLENKRIMFWHAISQVVDYNQITQWLEENFQHTQNGSQIVSCDAMTFDQCIEFVKGS